MVIKNKTRGTILSKSAIKAETLMQKAFGLIPSSKPTTMIFQTRFGIHTFFMKYSIDVLILDNKSSVVDIKLNLKPNSIYLWNPKYKQIIELPSQTIAHSKTQLGDTILLKHE